MRSDFKKMEEEMENLVVNMGEITEFNEKINFSFKDGRKEISRLSDVDTLLKKVRRHQKYLAKLFKSYLFLLHLK